MKYLIILVLVCWNNKMVLASSQEIHYRPTPSMPIIKHPATVNDVFSLSLLSQIHATLFKMDDSYTPKPYLVEKFEVTNQGTLYTIHLKNVTFHDGSPLNSEIVKKSLEHTVMRRASGYEKLACIEGYKKFVEHGSKEISGIKPISASNIQIKLIRASPQLIQTLSDIHFAILSQDKSEKIGLGPYKIIATDSSSATIEKVVQRNDNTPFKVVFVKASKEDAIDGFRHGKYSDLFLYSFNKSEIEELKKYGRVTSVFFPRTYLLAANSRNVKNIRLRKHILGLIKREEIISKCYPDNTMTNSLVPPGFPGYINDLPKSTFTNDLDVINSKATLQIGVATGVNNEECVQNILKNTFTNMQLKVTVSKDDTEKLLNKWNSGRLDFLFAYLESENTFEMFQFFNPDATFNFGVKGDMVIKKLLTNYESDANPVARKQSSDAISEHILSSAVVLPLFHPKQSLVYSTKYEEIQTGIRSSNLIDFESFRFISNSE